MIDLLRSRQCCGERRSSPGDCLTRNEQRSHLHLACGTPSGKRSLSFRHHLSCIPWQPDARQPTQNSGVSHENSRTSESNRFRTDNGRSGRLDHRTKYHPSACRCRRWHGDHRDDYRRLGHQFQFLQAYLQLHQWRLLLSGDGWQMYLASSDRGSRRAARCRSTHFDRI